MHARNIPPASLVSTKRSVSLVTMAISKENSLFIDQDHTGRTEEQGCRKHLPQGQRSSLLILQTVNPGHGKLSATMALLEQTVPCTSMSMNNPSPRAEKDFEILLMAKGGWWPRALTKAWGCIISQDDRGRTFPREEAAVTG